MSVEAEAAVDESAGSAVSPAAGHSVGVTPANRAPLYHQIFLVLQSQIHNGDYALGDYLPSERELSERFGVSRITTMRAMNELAESGLVVREQGRGTRVRFVGQGVVTRGPAFQPEAGQTAEGPEGATRPLAITVHDVGDIPVPPPVAKALGLAAGAPVQRAVRVLGFAGGPFSQLTTFVPAEIARAWSRTDLETLSVQSLLARAGFHPERLDERVSATLADALLAERLETGVGAPLIHIVRTSFADDGRGLEHVVGVFRPDLYQYSVSLNAAGQLRAFDQPHGAAWR